MADNVSNGLPKRGKTRFSGTPDTITGPSVSIEGTEVNFMDDYKSGNEPRRRRSGRFITARLVRNVSGITLLPGRTVTWKTGYRGTRVDGYSTTTAQEVAGVVDDQLPTSGVANNDLFWLMIKGPALIKTPLAAGAGSVFAAGDVLAALAKTLGTSADYLVMLSDDPLPPEPVSSERMLNLVQEAQAAYDVDGATVQLLRLWSALSAEDRQVIMMLAERLHATKPRVVGG